MLTRSRRRASCSCSYMSAAAGFGNHPPQFFRGRRLAAAPPPSERRRPPICHGIQQPPPGGPADVIPDKPGNRRRPSVSAVYPFPLSDCHSSAPPLVIVSRRARRRRRPSFPALSLRRGLLLSFGLSLRLPLHVSGSGKWKPETAKKAKISPSKRRKTSTKSDTMTNGNAPKKYRKVRQFGQICIKRAEKVQNKSAAI